ncbi:MAG: SWIM zinc finger family protein [Bacteroidales bacterium]
MQIPLNQFEQYIDETILKRGLQYFKKGRVHVVEEIGHGKYEAIVEGTEDYTVQLTLKTELSPSMFTIAPTTLDRFASMWLP